MKVNRCESTPSFLGYKNIIANDINTDKFRFLLLSMQLDDKDNPDLSDFRKYKNMIGAGDENLKKDTLACIYMDLPEMHSSDLFLNNHFMVSGEALKDMQYNMPKPLYKNTEGIMLKAYTLIAGITKRIMNDNALRQDIQLSEVVRHTFETMSSIYQNQATCFNVLKDTLQKHVPPQKVASVFNNRIVQTMQKLFM